MKGTMEKCGLEQLAEDLAGVGEKISLEEKVIPTFEPQKAPKLTEAGGYEKRQALLSPVQLADLLGLDPAFLRRAFKARKLPHYRIGPRYFGILEEILQAMAVGIKNSVALGETVNADQSSKA